LLGPLENTLSCVPFESFHSQSLLSIVSWIRNSLNIFVHPAVKLPILNEQTDSYINYNMTLYYHPRRLQRESQRADEFVRMIKDRLELAVEDCIQAAGHEWESTEQKNLLRVSVVFKPWFCFTYSAL
jgi:hypothetical protein